MRVGLFGGSFDPVHREHVRLVAAAIRALALDEIVIIPSFVAPHKRNGAVASAENRLEMAEIAFQGIKKAQISDHEIFRGDTSFTYLTAEYFAKAYAGAELYWLVGADMLEDFFSWKLPDRILSCVTLAACGRGNLSCDLHERFRARFHRDFVSVPFCGEEVSSTRIRVAIAFGKKTEDLPEGVRRYIDDRGLYTHPAIAPALALEKQERREHSYRVALLAAECAPRYGISQKKAILASALHDCGKYVPLSSPLLCGFSLPDGVPAPVVHQYTGAYLAEHAFGVTDEEVLDAIRYHTSGREDMTPLGKLIFLADMLEEGREFPEVERLRAALKRDLDECLLLCFEHQNAYLEANQSKGCEIYSLTKKAYNWIKSKKS